MIDLDFLASGTLTTTLLAEAALPDENKTYFTLVKTEGKDVRNFPITVECCLPSGSLTPDTVVFKQVDTMDFYGIKIENYQSTWFLYDK